MAGKTYRIPPSIRVLTKTIDFNSAGYATGIDFGILPLGAMPVEIEVDVLTAFNIAAIDRPLIGFTSGGFQWITASEMQIDVLGLSQKYKAFLTNGLVTPLPLAAPRGVIFKGFGTPTVGKAIIHFKFEY